MTNTELKAKIETAIDSILSGNQAYSLLGRSFTKANLKDLWMMHKEVSAAVKAEEGGGDVKMQLAVLRP